LQAQGKEAGLLELHRDNENLNSYVKVYRKRYEKWKAGEKGWE
jgi:hypothetical protein